jgi:fructose-bisphosphate aldolase class I
MDQAQLDRFRNGRGFIAALDQSGGSTPGALAAYGIGREMYSTDSEMFDLVQQLRARMMTAPSFNSTYLVGTILFEGTLDRTIEGRAVPEYLWNERQIVPFLKVDRGLADVDSGVQLMKPIPDLDTLCERASSGGVLGTKMRSFVKEADEKGIASIIEQQFELGRAIRGHGLLPILEPEIDIHCPDKPAAEELMRASIRSGLDDLAAGEVISLKLTLPETDDFYAEFVSDPRVVRVVALSGGYSQSEADEKLARNHGVIASFSRALAEGLTAQQSDEEFDATLRASVERIAAASAT